LPEFVLVCVFAHRPALSRKPELGVEGKVLEVVFREVVAVPASHGAGCGTSLIESLPMAAGQWRGPSLSGPGQFRHSGQKVAATQD